MENFLPFPSKSSSLDSYCAHTFVDFVNFIVAAAVGLTILSYKKGVFKLRIAFVKGKLNSKERAQICVQTQDLRDDIYSTCSLSLWYSYKFLRPAKMIVGPLNWNKQKISKFIAFGIVLT